MPISTYTKIATQTLISPGTLNFTSIPATYTDLVVTGSVRGTGTGTVVNMWFRYNGDSTSGNYTDARAYATTDGAAFSNDTTSSGIGEAYIGAISAASASSGYYTPIHLTINSYSNTSIYRSSYCLQNAWNYESVYRQHVWKTTGTAINQIEFLTGASFAAGSTITIWGIKAA